MKDNEKFEDINPIEEINQIEDEAIYKEQSIALTRLLKHSKKSITQLSKLIGANRQTIYLWKKGVSKVPKEKAELMAKEFGVEPVEIMFNIKPYNRDDLEHIVTLLEKTLEANKTRLKPENKSKIISALYEMIQDHKMALSTGFSLSQFDKYAVSFIAALK